MKKKVTLALLALAIAGTSAWYFWPQAPSKNLAEQMSRLAHSLDSRLLESQPWMVGDYGLFRDVNGNVEPRATAFPQAEFRDLKAALKVYAQKIPEAEGLDQLLDSATLGLIVEGEFQAEGRRRDYKFFLIRTELWQRSFQEMDKQLKFVYFGSDQWEKVLEAKKAAAAHYDPELDTLLVPCIQFVSAAVRNDLFFHELKHAQQWRRRKQSSSTPVFSEDDRADDEVMAYRLGGKILNLSTGGDYVRRLGEVVDKRHATSATDLIMKLKNEDVIYLDELFGKDAGGVESSIRRFSYYFGLGDEWIRRNVPAERQTEAIRELYKEFASSQPK